MYGAPVGHTNDRSKKENRHVSEYFKHLWIVAGHLIHHAELPMFAACVGMCFHPHP
jgi:hypothetical protein